MPLTRKLIELVGKTFGLVIVPNWRAVRLDEERHLARLLRYLDVDCVFDVGANIGQYGRMLRDCVGYRGRIVSFEPNPAALDRLQVAASGDVQWHVERIALGSTPGIAEFHAYDRSELGSFRNFGQSAHAPKIASGTTVDVEIQTLKSYIIEAKRRWNFKRPFLKLDTQGFDLEVAKGAWTSAARVSRIAERNCLSNDLRGGAGLSFGNWILSILWVYHQSFSSDTRYSLPRASRNGSNHDQS